VKAFVDRLSAPVLEFAVDETNARILLHGGDRLDDANYRIVLALITNFRSAKATSAEVPFIRAPDLATVMNIDEQSLRQQVSRLRKAIEPLAVKLGIPMDQNTFIETKERAGYRINPDCREISVADVRAADRALLPG
jgi:DNA-binding response OmpR family regulator